MSTDPCGCEEALALRAEVATLRGQKSGLESTIEGLRTDEETLLGRIAKLEAELESLTVKSMTAYEASRILTGWANYETWCVALWINNDQVSQEHAYDIVRNADRYIDATEKLKDWCDDSMPQVDGMWADLLNAAFG